jgi:serine/threonine-protein kinase
MREPVEFGKYQLVRRLAVSSMSEVFLALRSSGPRTPVVVKRLLEDVASVDTFVSLFHNEADLAASMKHPNVVELLEFGEHDGRLYLVMEYVEGLDLWRLTRRLQRAGSRVPAASALAIVVEVLKALSYLHALEGEDGEPLNIVHHDVSPSNILVGRTGKVKLGDFGIAYSEQRELQDLGRKFKGKVQYLSPEQVRGAEVDQRSDLYSAAVVLVELLLGRRPFEGPTDLSIIINIKDRISPVLDEGLASLPRDMAAVLDRAMAVDPDERFQDADSFRDALLALMEPRDVEQAKTELPALLESVTRRSDGVRGLSQSPRVGFDMARAIAESSAATQDEEGEDRPLSSREDAEASHDRTPATPVKDVSRYTVQKMGGEVMGAMPLSELIESIVCGRIQEEDLVSVNGTDFRPVNNVDELSKHLPAVTPTERMHALGLPDRRGLLVDTPVVDVFLEVYRSSESGLLIFECSDIRKDVFIEGGTPRYISSNVASELLGEYLVRRGIISRMELDMALAVLDKFDGHLGDTLLGLDILDSITLLRAITSQIKERLFDIYGWETGEFHFYRKASPVPRGFRLSVPALELIKDGVLSSLRDEDSERWFEENRRSHLVLDPEMPLPIEEWKLGTSYAILLEELESTRRLDDIMRPYEHSSREVRGKLLKVLRFGLLVGLLKRP